MPDSPQNFFDEARIAVRGGRGGDGMAHFRREKYVPRGGPDGGDGGRGGELSVRARANLAALTAFQFQQRFQADDGTDGAKSQRHGRDGGSLIIDVPCGTVVYDASSGALLADLVSDGYTAVVAKGGRGGWGNVHFKSSRFQAPELALRGEPGQERTLRLELELIADAGLVGAPNAGKSSLLSVVSAAHPKIAPYPFTTLAPVLGVVTLNDFGFVLADLPGLIEGASRGAGLGFQFLRHVRRARVLVHVVDGAGLERNPVAAYDAIRREMVTFDATLGERPEIVAFNKMDLVEARAHWSAFQVALRARGREAIAISTATREGVRDLVERTAQALAETPRPPRAAPGETIVLRPEPVDELPRLFRRVDGAFVVRDAKLERLTRGLNLRQPDARLHFQRQLDRTGVTQRLEEAGVSDGDTVVVGGLEFEWTERPE